MWTTLYSFYPRFIIPLEYTIMYVILIASYIVPKLIIKIYLLSVVFFSENYLRTCTVEKIMNISRPNVVCIQTD